MTTNRATDWPLVEGRKAWKEWADMGYYINPNGDKGIWLNTNGAQVSFDQAQRHDAGKDDHFVVCLVDNGWMTAAAIAYNDRERDVFARDDGRPKKWFLVKRDALKPFCPVL